MMRATYEIKWEQWGYDPTYKDVEKLTAGALGGASSFELMKHPKFTKPTATGTPLVYVETYDNDEDLNLKEKKTHTSG